VKKFFLILLAIALVGALIFGGCAKPAPTPTPTPTPTPKPAPQKVLKIGTSQALNDPSGVEAKNWFELFAKLVNDQGGLQVGGDRYKVEMIVYDSQGDAVKAKTNLEKLVLQDGVKFVFGSIFGVTGSAPVDITVTEPNKVINLSGDVTDVSAAPNVQYFYAVGGTYFGRGMMYRVYKDMVAKGAKTYVSIKPDNEWGHMGAGLCNPTWTLLGVKQLGETIYYDPSTTDFAPIATKAKALNADVVEMQYCTTVVPLYRALKDAGYKGIIVPAYADPDTVANLVTAVGKEFIEGGESLSVDPRGFQKDPEMLAIIDAYLKEYGDFRTVALLQGAPWFVLKDAIEQTQSVDVEAIKKYLDNSTHAVKTLTAYAQLFARPDLGNYRTICGTPVDLLARIRDGKFETFATIGPKTHYLCTILSYDLVDIYKKYWEEYGYPTFPDEPSAISFSDLGITGRD